MQKALQYASKHTDHICVLEGNKLPYLYGSFPTILAFGARRILRTESFSNAFEALEKFENESQSTIYGYLSYDLKNEIEQLQSENSDFINFPTLLFFEPETEMIFSENKVQIMAEFPEDIYRSIASIENENFKETSLKILLLAVRNRISKDAYISKVIDIQNHIKRGDVYELNFCQEFFIENIEIEPIEIFTKLNNISPMPFASFLRCEDKYLICASPERFLKKEGHKLISQPIKGTVRRGKSAEEDLQLIEGLLNSDKERAENVMIVDLVRNDLSKIAKDATVRAEELCSIYSFSNVHQMVSTVVAEIDDNSSNVDVIKSTFPMGSMTGAPKLSAMKLIEKFEETKRGLFSGSVGYIAENSDFDFNVVIRSILYNSTAKYLSFQVGSAITIDAVPEKEWEECRVKISAILKVLGVDDKIDFT